MQAFRIRPAIILLSTAFQDFTTENTLLLLCCLISVVHSHSCPLLAPDQVKICGSRWIPYRPGQAPCNVNIVHTISRCQPSYQQPAEQWAAFPGRIPSTSQTDHQPQRCLYLCPPCGVPLVSVATAVTQDSACSCAPDAATKVIKLHQ